MRASNAKSPRAMGEYRLRDHSGLDIGGVVAGAPHRQDDIGIRRPALDLLAQALHQRVYAANGYERLILPDLAEKRFSTEHNARVTDEDVQQLELIEGQPHLAVANSHASAGGIDFNMFVTDWSCSCACGGASLRRFASTQQCSYSGEQLANPERL